MNSIFQLAQAWLEHCRNAAEAEEGMDDYAASMWHEQAEEAERVIKQHIDTVPNFDDVCSAMFNHPDFVVGNVLAKQHIIDNGMNPDKLDPKLSEWASEPISETMWECVAEAYTGEDA